MRALGVAISLLLKLIAIAIAIALPLLGAWLSSSLAAYSNGPVWLAALVGLVLFPIAPALWEAGASLWRRRKRPARERILRLSDRIILRTLALNVVFLAAMLAFFPDAGFRALATRGDWMLDGREGESVDRVRSHLFGLAEQLEWLYERTHDDPIAEELDEISDSARSKDESSPEPKPEPEPEPGGETPAETPARAWPLPETVHPLVASLPPGVETDYASVARYIAAGELDPRQRIKALHDYVATRIAYDAVAYVRGDYPPQDAETVFRTRKAVCAGYATLLDAMAEVTGDEVVMVVGNARFAADTIDGMGHAWNAARIDGQWYLIDATWDSGSVNGERFLRDYGTTYLFTPPEVFGLDHLPEDDSWQLRDKPMTRGEFMRQPLMRPEAFVYGLRLRSPDRSQVTVDGRIDITVDVPPGVTLIGTYEPLAGGEREHCEVHPGRTTRITCQIEQPGRYAVWLFAARGEEGRYEGVGHIEVNNR